MVIVVLSALLGAALLAIALLIHWMRKTRAEITRLHTELVATKIAALTRLPLAPAHEENPEPTRRKRHLALYIGGAAVAFLASFGDRLRALARQRRTVAIAVAATSILAMGSAAAYYANTGGGATSASARPAPSATIPGTDDSDAPGPESGAPTEPHADTESGTAAPGKDDSLPDDHLAHPDQVGVTEELHQGDSGHSNQKHPGDDTPGEPSTPASAPPTGAEPPAQSPTPAPPSTTEPEPSQSPTTTPPPSGGPGDGLCTGLPALLGLCDGK